MSQEIPSDIKYKVDELLNVEAIIKAANKQIKDQKIRGKELKKEIIELLTLRNITECKHNDKIITLITKKVLKPLNDETMKKGISKKIKNVNVITDYKKITEEIIENITKSRENKEVKKLVIKKYKNKFL